MFYLLFQLADSFILIYTHVLFKCFINEGAIKKLSANLIPLNLPVCNVKEIALANPALFIFQTVLV